MTNDEMTDKTLDDLLRSCLKKHGAIGEVHVEFGRSWWQWVIPISKVLVVDNYPTGKNKPPEFRWVWRKPEWLTWAQGRR